MKKIKMLCGTKKNWKAMKLKEITFMRYCI